MTKTKTILEKINEATEVSLFKQILDIFGEYCSKFPATGVDAFLNKVIDKGKGAIPSDKLAQAIIKSIIDEDNKSAVVQKMLNIRFANLPVALQPRYKNGRKIEVAFWTRNDVVVDKVISLFNLDKGVGKWTNEKGEKIELIGDK